MSIQKDLQELVNAEVISKETSDRIQTYYQNKSINPRNRLLIIFGVFGAILVGVGASLIIAQNWEKLSILTKTVLSFTPMIIGQILCGFVLIKKEESIPWRESAAAFLFFSVGGCISLVSMIYDIPGSLSSYLLAWMFLCLPLIYIMKSSMVSLLLVIGATVFAIDSGYGMYSLSDSYLYWVLILLVIPHYYLLLKEQTASIFLALHHWIIPGSLLICLGTVADKYGLLMFLAYICLFGLFYNIGNTKFFSLKLTLSNGYKILGSLGTIVLLLIFSFKEIWKTIRGENYVLSELMSSPELIAIVLISAVALILLYTKIRIHSFRAIDPHEPLFIFMIATFFIGLTSPVSVVLVNIITLVLGILTIIDGARKDHLGVLNFGLLIIAALAVCRFFDTDISFVVRGIMFLIVGFGFFAANYWLILKRKSNE